MRRVLAIVLFAIALLLLALPAHSGTAYRCYAPLVLLDATPTSSLHVGYITRVLGRTQTPTP